MYAIVVSLAMVALRASLKMAQSCTEIQKITREFFGNSVPVATERPVMGWDLRARSRSFLL